MINSKFYNKNIRFPLLFISGIAVSEIFKSNAEKPEIILVIMFIYLLGAFNEFMRKK